MAELKVENKGISGTKKNGLWFIRATRGGVVSTMDKVLDIESYQCMCPSYLLDQHIKS